MSRIKARVVHQGRSQGRNEAVETEAPLFILLSFSSLRRNFFKGLMFSYAGCFGTMSVMI
jgi:hypothetical protein